MVKLNKFVPTHQRTVLSHTYRNVDIPRTTNVYDHTMYEGNPEKTWCIKTEDRILIEGENPSVNSLLIYPKVNEIPTKNIDFVKFNANENDIGIKIYSKDLFTICKNLNLSCLGFVLFSKWLENRKSEFTQNVSSLQVKLLDDISFRNPNIGKDYNGLNLKKIVKKIFESLLIRARELENLEIFDIDLDDSDFSINKNESSDDYINDLLFFVQNKVNSDNSSVNSVNLNLEEDNITNFNNIYTNFNVLRRLSFVLTFIELSQKWDSLLESDKYRITFALRRYSDSKIIEKNDILFYKSKTDESKMVDKYIVEDVLFNEGKVKVIQDMYNKTEIFYLEDDFSIIKNLIKTKDVPTITVIPSELTNKMKKNEDKPLTEKYFPFLLDSLVPSNTEIISREASNFVGTSYSSLYSQLKSFGLSDDIIADEFSLLIDYIPMEKVRSLIPANRNIYYPSQIVSNLQPNPKYAKNRFTQTSNLYEIAKLKTGFISKQKEKNKFAHLFSDSFITHPDIIKGYGKYPGIFYLYQLNKNDIDFLRKMVGNKFWSRFTKFWIFTF